MTIAVDRPRRLPPRVALGLPTMAWHSSSVAADRQLGELGAREPDQHRDRQADPPHPGQPAQVLAEHRADGGRQSSGTTTNSSSCSMTCGAVQEPRLIQVDLARSRRPAR